MTRAMDHLYMTYAEVRRMYGSESHSRPSRFIDEIPAERIEEIRPRKNVQRPYVSARPAMPRADRSGESLPFRLGQRVQHRKFGEGTVVTFEGSGEHARVQVNFQGQGSKWLVLAYANLEALP
jgi:DNA helicase-2/ATP-dependent DNA helicase PcrA